MTKLAFRIITVVIFVFVALGIGALLLFPHPWDVKKGHIEQQARMIIPHSPRTGYEELYNPAEDLAREDNLFSKVELEDGEVLVTVLTNFFDGGPVEKQFVAYRNLLEIESPIYLTFIDYDEKTLSYNRLWSAQTAASRPGTVNLYTEDLLGDRSLCVLLQGMNGQGQHTLTVFRKEPFPGANSTEPFSKIAELKIDGNITVKEVTRGSSYQNGIGTDASYTISAFGRDPDSANLLDQVEITYTYNEDSGFYEETAMSHIPGSQVEQRRLRELLGNAKVFQEFISGLWYYVSPQGNINKNQYIYFDPPSNEIIFYDDETQQVFNWTNAAVTRYGLYITSQNISVSTLRRSIDIELESLDSIRVRVIEDVRLKFGVNTLWDGSYIKAGPPENQVKTPSAVNAQIDALYEGQMGKVHFYPDGTFQITAGNSIRQGKYAFFYLNDQELIELRSIDYRTGELRFAEIGPADLRSAEPTYTDAHSGPSSRETYLIESDSTEFPRKNLSLIRVMIGSRGIERSHERAITLTLVSE